MVVARSLDEYRRSSDIRHRARSGITLPPWPARPPLVTDDITGRMTPVCEKQVKTSGAHTLSANVCTITSLDYGELLLQFREKPDTAAARLQKLHKHGSL